MSPCIKGLVVMSADLDEIFNALAANKVPAIYLKSYPSLKPLGSWTRDLLARLDQLNKWIKAGAYTRPHLCSTGAFSVTETSKAPHHMGRV